MKSTVDVLVIGAGHAGIEAASAAARMGCLTTLVTFSSNDIGQMSCNPSIGGIGKTHLLQEVDALGGELARAADQSSIQIRLLNASRGPAVQATRVQADRALFQAAMAKQVKRRCDENGLQLVYAAVDRLLVENNTVKGVGLSDGSHINATCVVLATGTFLGGVMHTGGEVADGGRHKGPSASVLAQQLRELPISIGRLKTGTPPRLLKETIDFDQLERQDGDSTILCFSLRSSRSDRPRQIPCWITETNPDVHDVIRSSLDQWPMRTGAIEGGGPRYCPSLEDKIVKFQDRSSHKIYLEPEGLTNELIYPNGISMSVPSSVQLEAIRKIKGLSRVEMETPGYAVEYDYLDPSQMKRTLESQHIEGLFLSGQINGTTGYEEAAAQGAVAGINAALKVKNEPEYVLSRESSVTGVMIDDLVSRGVNEPYRMFTSRAEHRLHLRTDNAQSRLGASARKLGILDEESRAALEQYQAAGRHMRDQRISDPAELLRSKDVKLCEMFGLPDADITLSAIRASISDRMYAGYIKRQRAEVRAAASFGNVPIPQWVDANEISGLSHEARDALLRYRPRSVEQAARLPGMGPAAVTVLLIYLQKNGRSIAHAPAH